MTKQLSEEENLVLKMMRMGFETISEKVKVSPEITPDEVMKNAFDVVSQINSMTNKFFPTIAKSEDDPNVATTPCEGFCNNIIVPTNPNDLDSFFVSSDPYFVEENKVLLQSRKTNGNEFVPMTEDEMKSFFEVFDHLFSSQQQKVKEMMSSFKNDLNDN